jgi:hypothetical protein
MGLHRARGNMMMLRQLGPSVPAKLHSAFLSPQHSDLDDAVHLHASREGGRERDSTWNQQICSLRAFGRFPWKSSIAAAICGANRMSSMTRRTSMVPFLARMFGLSPSPFLTS